MKTEPVVAASTDAPSRMFDDSIEYGTDAAVVMVSLGVRLVIDFGQRADGIWRDDLNPNQISMPYGSCNAIASEYALAACRSVQAPSNTPASAMRNALLFEDDGELGW